MKKKFIQFLKDNNAYYAFVCNLALTSNFTLSSYIRSMRLIRAVHLNDLLVCGGFDWRSSKEGRIYWNTLENKWLELLSKE